MPVAGGIVHRRHLPWGHFGFSQRERQLRHADGRYADHLRADLTSDSTITGAVKGKRGTLIVKNAGVFTTLPDGSIVDPETIVGGTGKPTGARGLSGPRIALHRQPWDLGVRRFSVRGMTPARWRGMSGQLVRCHHVTVTSAAVRPGPAPFVQWRPDTRNAAADAARRDVGCRGTA